MIPTIKIQKNFSDALLPKRSHPTDSGLDVYAYKLERITDDDKSLFEGDSCTIVPNGRIAVDTGISATVDAGYEIQVRPRSGLAYKEGLTVLNTPGTIDESYRGHIKVILINLSNKPKIVSVGERIAQIVVCPVILSEVEEVLILPASGTDRNTGGFGSTGKK